MTEARVSPLRTVLQATLAHLQRNEFDSAERLLERVIAQDPNNCDALHLFGQVRRVQGRFAEAEVYYHRALRIEPGRAELHHHLGQLLTLTGRLDEAEAALRDAVRFRANFADAFLELGNVQSRREAFSDAESSYREALKIQPSFVAANLALSAALIALKREKEAETTLRSALREVSAGSQLTAALEQNLAIAVSAQGRHDEALARFARAQTLAPDLPHGDFNRANTLQATGRLEEAESAYRAAISRNALDLKAHQGLSQLLYRLGRDDFLSSFDVAIAAFPGHAALRIEKAKFLSLTDRLSEAAECFAQAVTLSPDNVIAADGLASTMARLKKFEEANRTFDRLIRLRPHDAQIRRNFADCLIRQGAWREALSQVDAVLTRDPDDQLALGLSGLALRGLNDSREEVMNNLSLVQTFELEVPLGFSSVHDFNAELERYLIHLHRDAREHINQTSRLGTKTLGTLFGTGHALVERLRERTDQAVRAYIARMMDDPRHPLLRRKQASFSYGGAWSTRLASGGFHTNHVHPRGWISSAYYVSVPHAVDDELGKQGWLKFGEAPFEIGPVGAARHAIKPVPGMLVLFPSYMWHGTVPFQSPELRTTIAFDAVPAPN